MSGILVGQVIDAAENGRLDHLSPNAFAALLVVAEKCHTTTRQASIRWARLQGAIRVADDEKGSGSRPASRSTADRAMRELRDGGLVRVVKRGYKANGQSTATAPIYELLSLEVSPDMMTQAQRPARVVHGDESSGT